MNVNKHLDTIMKDLFNQANRDQIITDDEYILIQSIEIEIDNYIAGLEYALEDGVIDADERDNLQHLVERIHNKAIDVANADGIIDKDEENLIIVLKDVLSIYLS